MPDHERQRAGLIWSDDSYDRYRAPFYDHHWDYTLERAMEHPSGIDERGRGIWPKNAHRSYRVFFGRSIPARVVKETLHFGPCHISIAVEKSIQQRRPIEDWDKFLKKGAYELASPEYDYACYAKWGTGIRPPWLGKPQLQWDD